MNYLKRMEQGNSYRHILKWGDKHEEILSRHMAEVVKEKFGLKDEDFSRKHLPGTDAVIRIPPSAGTAVEKGKSSFAIVSAVEPILRRRPEKFSIPSPA